MRLKLRIILILLFCILFIYITDISSNLEHVPSYKTFIDQFFMNLQSYLFIISLFVCLYLGVTVTPYLNAEYQVRYGKNTFWMIIEKGIFHSIIWTISIIAISLAAPSFYGFEVTLYAFNLYMIIVLFSFIMSIYVLSQIYYLLIENHIIALVITGVTFLTILMGYYGYTFFAIEGDIQKSFEIQMMLMLSSLIIVGGMIFMYLNLKHRDYLV